MTPKKEFSPTMTGAVGALCRFGHPDSPLIDVSIGLAMMRDRNLLRDVRSELIEWFFSHNDAQRDQVLSYTACRIICYAARCGVSADTDAFAYATLDALARVRRGNRRHELLVPSAVRAKQLRISKATYLDLRSAGEEYLLRGVREGLSRYLEVCGYSEPATPAKVQTGVISLNTRPTNESVAATAPHRRLDRQASLKKAA